MSAQIIHLNITNARSRKAVRFMTEYLRNRLAFDDNCPEYALKMAIKILEGQIDYNPVSRSFHLSNTQ